MRLKQSIVMLLLALLLVTACATKEEQNVPIDEAAQMFHRSGEEEEELCTYSGIDSLDRIDVVADLEGDSSDIQSYFRLVALGLVDLAQDSAFRQTVIDYCDSAFTANEYVARISLADLDREWPNLQDSMEAAILRHGSVADKNEFKSHGLSYEVNTDLEIFPGINLFYKQDSYGSSSYTEPTNPEIVAGFFSYDEFARFKYEGSTLVENTISLKVVNSSERWVINAEINYQENDYTVHGPVAGAWDCECCSKSSATGLQTCCCQKGDCTCGSHPFTTAAVFEFLNPL